MHPKPAKIVKYGVLWYTGWRLAMKTFLAAFLDGFTMAGLFERCKIPGSPTRLFAEPERRRVRVYLHPKSKISAAQLPQISGAVKRGTREAYQSTVEA